MFIFEDANKVSLSSAKPAEIGKKYPVIFLFSHLTRLYFLRIEFAACSDSLPVRKHHHHQQVFPQCVCEGGTSANITQQNKGQARKLLDLF